MLVSPTPTRPGTGAQTLWISTTSNTKNPGSFQNYTDYFKCIAAKGDDFAPCKQFQRAYNSLCPNEWIAKFDEQRDNGTFPASLEP
ncbi:Cytochrome c oxidase subunit 6B [Tephrocybe sp. NHM501043]|nr:Cytochrome c oxidase subunit 6B [Tephrocybe sp. NHM501043]